MTQRPINSTYGMAPTKRPPSTHVVIWGELMSQSERTAMAMVRTQAAMKRCSQLRMGTSCP